MSSNIDINKAYVSPHDEFLFDYDKTHAKTHSQLKEIEKHRRIALLRDQVIANDQDKIWENF